VASSLPVILAADDPGYVPINNAPDVKVEIAFNSGFTTPAADRIFVDVTEYVDLDRSGISVERGRGDQHSQVQPSRWSLTLNNRDGRFTPENTASPYYPNVRRGRPVRISATSVLGTASILVVGYVDTWPISWPGGSDAYSSVTVSGSSRMTRLGRSAVFRSIVEEEVLYDGPTCYWTLAEPAGALEAGNIAPGRSDRLTVAQVGSGGTLEFGAGTGPGTDDLTAPVLTRVDSSNGKYLLSSLVQPLNAPGDTIIDLEFWVAAVTASGTIATVVSPTSLYGLNVGIISGTVSANATFAGGVSQATIATDMADGNMHHVSARMTLSGSSVTASLIVDGSARTTAGSSVTLEGAAFPDLTRLFLGSSGTAPSFLTTPWSGTLAHAAMFSGTVAVADARIQAHYNAGANGFNTEASGARVARYGRLAGVPPAEITVETGLSTSIAHADTTGQSPIDMMQRVATTEDGLVFDGRDGTLTFHARDHRYTSTSAFTLSCTAGEVESDLSPVLDDQGMTNDMKATRAGGAEAHSVNQASIDDEGYYRDTVELMTTSDNEVQSRADWQVQRFGTPRVKLTSITVELTQASPAQQDLLLAADIGTRFTVSNLPSQAPASSMDFFVEGIGYEVGTDSFKISFNTSATDYANVWILDSSTQSQLDETTVLAY